VSKKNEGAVVNHSGTGGLLHRKRLSAVALTLLLLALISTTALANPPESQDGQSESFYPASSPAVEEAKEHAIPVAMPDSELDIAPETETQDLKRPEAEDLLQEVFGPSIEAPAEFFDELEIEAFRSDHVAVVAAPDPSEDAPAGLLSSSLPLRTEDETGDLQVVDLDLDLTQEHLEPENPLAELEIPAQLSDGISLPESNIEIELASTTAQRTASILGDASAFYPNVAQDTDFVVTAAPTGVETYTQLRSSDAPTRQVFELSLPAGHRLKERGDGGAQVLAADGETTMDVSPPSSLDAAGQRVPSQLKVVDHSLVISVDPPPGTVYPILIDPLYKVYDWMSGPGSWGTPYYWEWKSHADPSFMVVQNFLGRGAGVVARTGSVTPGQGSWNFYVPRFSQDISNVGEPPTSYIRNMKLGNLYYETDEPKLTWANPYLEIGLWSTNKVDFVAYGYRDGLQGRLTDPYYVYDLANPQEITDVKVGGFWLKNNTYYNSAERYVTVGQASTEVTDKDVPAFGQLGSVPEWVGNEAGSAINYRVSDTGLGIHRLRLVYPSASGGSGETTTTLACTGAGFSPCNRTVEAPWPKLPYNPSLMPQGENWVKIYASDPIGNQSSVGQSRVKVDHSGPAISLSGGLMEQGALGTNLPEYILSYIATDGDDAPAAAATPLGAQGTAPGQLERPIGMAVDADGDIWTTDRTNNRVVQYSKDGKFISQFGVAGSGDGQLGDLRGIAVGTNGNLWVTQAGTKGVQQFTPTGSFVSKITHPEFSGVWGIAISPSGVVWLADQNTSKIYRYKEDGTFLKSLYRNGLVPTGIDVDRFGDAWVASQGEGGIRQILAASNTWGFRFGSGGTGDGQFQNPLDVEVAESGNIIVMDDPGRVQVFKPDGTFMRKFGTPGAGSSQFNEPRGIAIGPDNMAYISDAGNHRIARWTHADQDPQSGTAKVEIKVDGATAHTKAPGCATKNCQVSGSWVLDVDDYGSGAHKVDVIATDAVGIVRTRSIVVETHGDGTDPNISLSGTMTQQASIGTTRPSYSLKAEATDPGPAQERKSGVASTVIKIDGQVVDSASPGCAVGGCSVVREWTLNSSSYSPGPHNVEVKATDGAGRSSVKTMQIQIARDTTAPVFEALDPFYTSPGGWLEQRTYPIQSLVTDAGGYGVTQVQLKVDGAVVLGATQACAAGGCSKVFGSEPPIDMTKYDGGAHPAELTATDGAGNTRKRSWTINVTPKGDISASEAEDTLEAVDATSPANTVGPPASEVTYEGTAEGLALRPEGDLLVAEGSAAPTTLDESAPGQLEIEIPAPTPDAPCPNRAPEEAEEPLTGQEEEELALTAGCEEPPVIPSEADILTPVSVTPISGAVGDSQTLTPNSAAAVVENVAPNVDLVTRPLFDGAMTFMAIRDKSGISSFSWRVRLEHDQTLTLKESKLAEVAYQGGPVAFTISAVLAHDAVGTSVPTRLSVAGDVLTLHVEHGTGSFVYPVVGGAGWEGGFRTYEVVMPPPEEEDEEPIEVEAGELGNGVYREVTFGPPQSAAGSAVPLGLGQSGPTNKRRYNFHDCRFDVNGGIQEPPEGPGGGRRREAVIKECHGEQAGGAFGEYFTLRWATAIHGSYFYKPQSFVWIDQLPQCKKWGPEQPAKLFCTPTQSSLGQLAYPKMNVLGFYRFPSGVFGVRSHGSPDCYRLNGVLPNRWVAQESGRQVLENTMHTAIESVAPKAPCLWQNLETIS
jgi:sugar lactone lactonase YvrE